MLESLEQQFLDWGTEDNCFMQIMVNPTVEDVVTIARAEALRQTNKVVSDE